MDGTRCKKKTKETVDWLRGRRLENMCREPQSMTKCYGFSQNPSRLMRLISSSKQIKFLGFVATLPILRSFHRSLDLIDFAAQYRKPSRIVQGWSILFIDYWGEGMDLWDESGYNVIFHDRVHYWWWKMYILSFHKRDFRK